MLIRPAKQELIIFAKPPLMGVSKTRLAHDIGPAQAARIARSLVANTVQKTNGDGRWRTILALTPARYMGRNWGGLWPPTLPKFAQIRGDLGAKLHHALQWSSARRVVIIGTDCPNLRRADIAQSFEALNRHDMVIGPATDGGFYLIGINSNQNWRTLFDAIRWSTAHTLDDLRANIPAGKRLAMLRPLTDIDTGADYHAWMSARAHSHTTMIKPAGDAK